MMSPSDSEVRSIECTALHEKYFKDECEAEHKAYEIAFEEEYKKMCESCLLKRVKCNDDLAGLFGSDDKSEQHEESIHCHHRTRYDRTRYGSTSNSQNDKSKRTYSVALPKYSNASVISFLPAKEYL
jgi:hypothetical protein